MFKNSPITPAGRWLITLVFAVGACLPVVVIPLALPALDAPLRGVLMGVALLWLVPLFLCTLQGHHWSRHLAGLLALAVIPVLLVHWSAASAGVCAVLMLAAVAAWATLIFVPAVRSQAPSHVPW